MVAEEESTRFLQDVPRVLRVKRLVLQDVRLNDQRIHSALLQVMASSVRLEQKLDHYLWVQKVFVVLVLVLTALWAFTLCILCSDGYSKWTTATH